MTATQERRRPAVPVHPLVAVPAATVRRLMPGVVLAHAQVSDVAHAVDGFGSIEGWTPRCRTRARRLVRVVERPLRMCSLCAAALTVGRLDFGWAPTKAELGDMHLYAADQLVGAVRERLADIRSAAIFDGSALITVEKLPTYRTTRGVPEPEPVPPLHAATILGQLLERISPDVVVFTVAEETAQQARGERAAADRQRFTDRTVSSSLGRRQDLRAARQGKKANR